LSRVNGRVARGRLFRLSTGSCWYLCIAFAPFFPDNSVTREG